MGTALRAVYGVPKGSLYGGRADDFRFSGTLLRLFSRGSGIALGEAFYPACMDEKPLEWSEFERVEMRIGTITSAEPNPKARKPAFVLEVDLGALGTRRSSAQLTENYEESALVGTQVVCVCNFEPKRVAGVKSEVLVLGVLDPEQGTILLGVERATANGARIA